MTFNTERFGQAAAGVCAHQGVAVSALSDERLVALQRDIGEARRTLDVLSAMVAGEVQTRADAKPGPGGIARQVGYRNAKQLVADVLGTSAGEAQRLVTVGKQLALADSPEVATEAPRWPLIAAATRANEITVEKAEILMGALGALRADADLERRFIVLAKRLRPYELRRACAREVAFNDPAGLEERERRLYCARDLTLTERIDGMTIVQGLLDPASAAHLRAWLDTQVRGGFAARREGPGDTRTVGQMYVDALAMLAHHAMDCDGHGSGFKTTMVFRADVTSLKDGVGVGTCDSMQTPISIGTLRAMAVDAGVLPMVMGGESLPLDVGRIKRLATPYQRAAILERDGGCAWCHAPASFCDVHHIAGWSFGGETNLDNLVALCVSCHHQIHFGGWVIQVERGVVWFTPPSSFDPERKRRKGGLADLVLAA